MQLRNDISLRETCGISVLVVPNGRQMTMVRLNETSSFLWNRFSSLSSFEPADMAKALTEEYDIDIDTAMRDVTHLLEQWQQAGLTQPTQ